MSFLISRPGILGVIFLWILPILVAGRIGRQKGRIGWLWGRELSWLGGIIVSNLKPLDGSAADVGREARETEEAQLGVANAKCSSCGTRVSSLASSCPSCGAAMA